MWLLTGPSSACNWALYRTSSMVSPQGPWSIRRRQWGKARPNQGLKLLVLGSCSLPLHYLVNRFREHVLQWQNGDESSRTSS